MTRSRSLLLACCVFILAVFSISLYGGDIPHATEQADLPVLYIYGWQDYFNPEVITAFEERHQCVVDFDAYDSYDTMLTKVNQPGSGYDLVVGAAGMVEEMHAAGLTGMIDRSRIPNTKYLISRVFDQFPDPGMRYHVPFVISAVCVAYNRTMVPEEDLGSWDIFGRLGYQDKAAMLSDCRFVLGVALKYLGYSANTDDPGEIAAAAELLSQWQGNIAQFSGIHARKALLDGEYAFIQAFTGAMLPMVRNNPDIDFFMPREGSLLNADWFCIPADAPSPDLAHAFIDFVLEPEQAAKIMRYGMFYMPHPEGRRLLDKQVTESVYFQIPYEEVSQCEPVRGLGDAARYYDAAWMSVLLSENERTDTAQLGTEE